MASKPKRSLQVFAKDKPFRPHRPCAICVLPEIKEINDARKAGNVAAVVIVQWLREECGYDHITIPTIENHFRRRHDVDRVRR